jgi:hypothetical protein
LEVGYFDSDEINHVCLSFDALVPLLRDSPTQDEHGLFTLSETATPSFGALRLLRMSRRGGVEGPQ